MELCLRLHRVVLLQTVLDRRRRTQVPDIIVLMTCAVSLHLRTTKPEALVRVCCPHENGLARMFLIILFCCSFFSTYANFYVLFSSDPYHKELMHVMFHNIYNMSCPMKFCYAFYHIWLSKICVVSHKFVKDLTQLPTTRSFGKDNTENIFCTRFFYY